MIWRRRRASCLLRTTTRRTCEVTRPRPWGTCCRRPGTCYVSSTDPSMSTCPSFSTPTSICGQTDCYRNRYQTTCITIIPRGLSVCVLFMYFIGNKESCNKIKSKCMTSGIKVKLIYDVHVWMYEWYLCNSIRSKTREWNKD